MNAVEQRFATSNCLSYNTGNSDITIDPKMESIGIEKKISRVLRLRDMFQTGVIKPIEEIDVDDAVTPPVANADKHLTDDRLRFLRTLPGSPPLSSLRPHQPKTNGTTTNSLPHPSIPNGTHPRPSPLVSSSGQSSPNPPATPPKPTNLPLELLPSFKRPNAFAKSKVSSELQKSIAIFENAQNDQPVPVNGPAKPARTAPKPSVQTNGSSELRKQFFRHSSSPEAAPSPSQLQPQTGSSSPPQLKQESITISLPPKRTAPEVISHATVTPNREAQSQSTPLNVSISPTGYPCGGSTPKPSPNSSVFNETDLNETEYESVESPRPDKSLLSSWRASSDLNKITTPIADGGNYQDVVVRPEAFRTSPTYMLDEGNLDHPIPELQHAEKVAISVVPGDEEGAGDVVERPSCPAPCLPVPPGLKVVAVDPEGIHIFEDGNFVYAAPGLPDDSWSSSVDEANDLLMRTHNSPERGCEIPINQQPRPTPEGNESLLPDSSHDSPNKFVRFSTEPILIFSTYSTSEYDRRNDDIDPLAASAEYELEKHLEEMDLINVELKKSAQGLGISILGLGVDNVGGEQKLGIFIKGLTPGGAAEANGQIMVFDQIVEVDGVSLVGVSQQFAAQTLRATKEIVHFVLAREKNPANSRIAQLLAEQEQDSLGMERAPNPLARSPNPSDESGVQEERTTREASWPSLEKVLSDGDAAAQQPDTPLSDDEVTELSAIGANSFMRETADSPDNEPHTPESSMNEQDQSVSSDSPGPRSALKGTATAASTKRRQDALLQLIRSAEERAKSGGEVQLPPLVSGVSKVAWILANDLYDSHTQLIKTQTQLQSIEQRLATQEAAAEEAIERLCLQCRHMELKLNEAQSNLHDYTQALQEGRLKFVEIDGVNGHSNNVVEEQKKTPPTPLSPSALKANTDSADLVSSQPASRLNETKTPQQLPRSASNDESTSGLVSSTAESSVWTERTRLVSSGGLANRRPRTRVVINPPPTMLPEKTNVIALGDVPSSSDVTYVQSVTQHLLFPIPSGKGSSGNVPEINLPGDTADPNNSSDVQRPTTGTSEWSSPSGTSTLGTPDSTTRSPSRKMIGVQLPGLSPGMLQSVALRRRSPTPDQPPKG